MPIRTAELHDCFLCGEQCDCLGGDEDSCEGCSPCEAEDICEYCGEWEVCDCFDD